MLRSMYAGVSGLKNSQTRMDVIGNNIANVNTVGYKKSRVVFKDAFYQAVRGASQPTDTRGGTNAMSIGLGMTVSSIDQIHTAAPATTTNKMTDMSVDGNGYFVVDNGGTKLYTRAGAFDFDKQGNLVNPSNGYRVQGWKADTDGKIDATGALESIDISSFTNVPPKATTLMNFSLNLDSKLTPMVLAAPPVATDGYPTSDQSVVTSKDYYDSLGNKTKLYFRFFKNDASSASDPPLATPTNTGKWACDISESSLFEKEAGYDPAIHPNEFAAVNVADPAAAAAAGAKIIRAYNIQFNDQGTVPKTLGAAAINSSINLSFPKGTVGAQDVNIKVDFSALTQFDSSSTAWAEEQDGYGKGDMTSFTTGIDGSIQGVYSNGTVKNMARVALVNFQNPAGLIQVGSNMFQVSNNSGDPRIGSPGEQGMGTVLPGTLEMSNVDLSEEFTDMIITQRGFQANSRIITTSDEMLQELVNLKR